MGQQGNGNGRGVLALVLVAVLSGIAVGLAFWAVAANYREFARLEEKLERRERLLRQDYDDEIKGLERELRVIQQTYWEDPKERVAPYPKENPE